MGRPPSAAAQRLYGYLIFMALDVYLTTTINQYLTLDISTVSFNCSDRFSICDNGFYRNLFKNLDTCKEEMTIIAATSSEMGHCFLLFIIAQFSKPTSTLFQNRIYQFPSYICNQFSNLTDL